MYCRGTDASARLSVSFKVYLRCPIDCLIELDVVLESDVLTVLVSCGTGTSASLPAASSHGAAEEVFEDGLEVAHVGLLSPAAIEAAETTTPHVAEYILIFESLVGVFVGRACLVVIPAFGLIGERLVGAD